MPRYNEQTDTDTVSVTTWERPYQLTFRAPLGAAPVVELRSTTATQNNDTLEVTVEGLARVLYENFDDLNETFPIYDNNDNVVTTVTYRTFLQALSSFFNHVAAKADQP